MARRFIPTDYEDEMLDALANLTGDFAEGVWDALSESDRDRIYTPLVVVCKLYNEGKIDFPEDTYCDDYQAILRLVPKEYLFGGPIYN